jgi:hypothetical protein
MKVTARIEAEEKFKSENTKHERKSDGILPICSRENDNLSF